MPAVAQGLPGLLGCTGLGASATQMEPGAQHQAKADGFPTAEVLSNKLGNKCCSKRVPTPHNELFQSPQNLCPRSSLSLSLFIFCTQLYGARSWQRKSLELLQEFAIAVTTKTLKRANTMRVKKFEKKMSGESPVIPF